MERTTFSVLFYIRRSKLNRLGEAPVIMRITVNGERINAYLKKAIDPKLWNGQRGRAIEKTPFARELNNYMDAVKLRLIKIQRDMEVDGVVITASRILDRYLGKDAPKRRTLVDIFEEHNEKCRKLAGIDMAPATVQKYTTCLLQVKQFIKWKYGKNDIFMDEVNRRFIEDLEFWYKTENGCAPNTTIKYLKNFKKIILIALKNGWMKEDPFCDIKFRLEEVQRDFLESHELKQLIEKRLDIPRLELVRDVFVFCCFTGLAFTDVTQLNADHISIDIHGNKWIRKPRQKTKNMCNIPLMEVPLRIIEKYKDHKQCKVKGCLLPVPSNQKMNAYLKEIGNLCGFKKLLTSHTARHTFATFTLANGVSIENVAKMLGHSDTKMTRHYTKVLDSSILRDMQKISMNF